MALRKISRLKKKKDIDKVFKKGITVKGSFFFVKALPNNLERGRFLVIVSRNVTQKAVERNRTKRRVTNYLSGYVERQQHDVVIVVTASILDKESQEINTAIRNVINKLPVKKK